MSKKLSEWLCGVRHNACVLYTESLKEWCTWGGKRRGVLIERERERERERELCL